MTVNTVSVQAHDKSPLSLTCTTVGKKHMFGITRGRGPVKCDLVRTLKIIVHHANAIKRKLAAWLKIVLTPAFNLGNFAAE